MNLRRPLPLLLVLVALATALLAPGLCPVQHVTHHDGNMGATGFAGHSDDSTTIGASSDNRLRGIAASVVARPASVAIGASFLPFKKSAPSRFAHVRLSTPLPLRI